MEETIDLDKEFDRELALRIGRVALSASECEGQLIELLVLTHELDSESAFSFCALPPNYQRTGEPLAKSLAKRLSDTHSHIAARYRELSQHRNAIIHSAWLGGNQWLCGFQYDKEGTAVRSKVTFESLDSLATHLVDLWRKTDHVISDLMGLH